MKKVLLWTMAGALAVSLLTNASAATKKQAKKDTAKTETKKTDEKKPEAKATSADEMEKVSYAFGASIGTGMKRNNLEIDLKSFIRGLEEAFAGKSTMSDKEIEEVIGEFQKKKFMEMVAKNGEESKKFLDANAKKEGVKTLPSGLQYKIIKEGKGELPKATDVVKVQYVGRLISGKEFDSSIKNGQPAKFQVDKVIAGWSEALQLMKVGSKWELYIPANLAYREQGYPPRIPPNSALIFEVELLEIVKDQPGSLEKK